MKKQINLKTTGFHLIAWIAYALITFNWVSSAWIDYEQGLIMTLKVISLHAFVFYVNVYVLLPMFMEKNKYALYLISIVGLLVAVHFIRESYDQIAPFRPEDFRGDMKNMPKPPGGFHDEPRDMGINPRIVINIVSAAAVLFISTTYWMTKEARKRQQAESSLKNENLNTELKLLKSQINPHFLFNALNNIYSLSFTSQKKAPDMIMKLSDMLRYVLYESNETKVTLDKEIKYINNYIDFQKLKIEGEANISVKIDVDNQSLLVEPMLFVPFIENAFKHSNIDHKDGWIKMLLSAKENTILFEISNSIPHKKYSTDQTSGIGLENVIKRLQLLYPDHNELLINEENDTYTVKLSILV